MCLKPDLLALLLVAGLAASAAAQACSGPAECDDDNPCTTDSCDGGFCAHTDDTRPPEAPSALDCDASACTVNQCVVGVCVELTEIVCITGNPCDDITDLCDPQDGCSNINNGPIPQIDCSDGVDCTDDTCVPNGQTAQCVNTPIAGFCDDGDDCTSDSCDATLGCVNDPLDCDDNNACTTDLCSGGSCVNALIDCDDGNPNTDDSCDTVQGCVNEAQCGVPTDCDDADDCTTDSCVNGGCVNEPLDCDDDNDCTTDSCSSGVCLNLPLDCNDDDLCTTDSCSGGVCTNAAVPCPDGEQCVLGICQGVGSDDCNDAVDCDDGIACTTDTCDAGVCVNTPILCNDGNACTVDMCDGNTGACSFEAISCSDIDGNACTNEVCIDLDGLAMCVTSAVDCDDGNLCTADACDTQDGCVHEAIGCPLLQTCNPASGVCEDIDIACIEDEDCTADPCMNAVCNLTTLQCEQSPRVCDDKDACTTDSCDVVNNVCTFTPVKCDDGDPCTTDMCSSTTGFCVYTDVSCDDSRDCTIDECDSSSGTCVNMPDDKLCDDGNACTSGTCDPTLDCVFDPIDCSDGNACTVDTCDQEIGCVNSVITCDDGDACTIDVCDPTSGCSYAPVVCDDDNQCTQDSCDPVSGCVFTPLIDGTSCDADASLCTPADVCMAGECVADVAVVCDANGFEVCNATTGLCQEPPADPTCGFPAFRPDGEEECRCFFGWAGEQCQYDVLADGNVYTFAQPRPRFVVHPPQPGSLPDHSLNGADNPIVHDDATLSPIIQACSETLQVEMLDENLTWVPIRDHVLYVTQHDQVYVAVMQSGDAQLWDMLDGRYVRLTIACDNGVLGQLIAQVFRDQDLAADPVDGCFVHFDLTNDWSSGYQASIRIDAGSELDAWLLQWTWPAGTGQQISSVWDAELVDNDGILAAVMNAPYNGNLGPGSSQSLGMVVSYTPDSLVLPWMFTLNGQACDCNMRPPVVLSPLAVTGIAAAGVLGALVIGFGASTLMARRRAQDAVQDVYIAPPPGPSGEDVAAVASTLDKPVAEPQPVAAPPNAAWMPEDLESMRAA